MAADFVLYGVPCKRSRSGPDIVGLHPEFRYRLWRALNDERLTGSAVYSGRRSVAHQKELYEKFLARNKRPPIVAKPGRSLHNERPKGFDWGPLVFDVPWSIAADIDFVGRPSRDVDPVMASYGLHRIRSEPWHWQPDKAGPVRVVAGEGSRGRPVNKIQTFLNGSMSAGLLVDGVYGPATRVAVEGFQRARSLPVRGDWSLADAAAAPDAGVSGDREALRRIRSIATRALRDR